MSEEFIRQFMEKISHVQHKYCGVLDENGFRLGTSCQQWFNRTFFQEYSGQFLYNNIQNKGTYFIDEKGDQTYYDGLFYCNKLEGYGKVVYANNTVFEGLFKQHLRFGPGVMTYSNDTQDVGMWEGFGLRRIMVSIGKDFVPRLGKTSFGKARLLKFRSLVPVCVKIPDLAKDILSQLTDDEDIIAQSDQLYSLHVRNPDSVFFNKNLYCANFAKEDCTIDVIISQEEFEGTSFRSQSNLDKESVAEESIEDYSFACCCFQPNLDRFGHLCMQLNDFELKLQTLAEKKEKVKQQLRTCKYCCENMPWVSPDDIKKIKIPQSRPASGMYEKRKIKIYEEKNSSTIRSSSSESEFSGNDALQHLSAKEIELQSYFYVTPVPTNNNDDNKDKAETISQKCSKTTLPFITQGTSFASGFASHLKFSQPDILYDLGAADYFEEFVQTDFIPSYPPCLCNEQLVDNVNVLQKQLESLIQEELFYTTIKNHLKSHLDIEFEKLNGLNQQETHFIRKVVITDLLAWNNEEIWISMLKHCFRHRSSEENMSFTVQDLLIGHRHLFKNPGDYELQCIQFLEDCSEGKEANVFESIRTRNINPDLCDARGNTGIMLATIRDKTNVITTLTNCGAKIDVLNDEGLTPLSISLLKYIAFKYEVSDWERTFLPEIKILIQDFQQWCPADSLISMYSNLLLNERQFEQTEKHEPEKEENDFEEAEERIVEVQGEEGEETGSRFDSKTMVMTNLKKQKYLFSVEYVHVSQEELHKSKAKSTSQLSVSSSGKIKKGKMKHKEKSTSKISASSSGKLRKGKMKHKEKRTSKINVSSSGKIKKGKTKHKEKSTSKISVSSSGKIRKRNKKLKEKSKDEIHKKKNQKDVNQKRTTEKVTKKLASIKKTIQTLLNHGSDPNIGEVPLTPIFLAVFADDSDLMNSLLTNNANPNSIMPDENMTVLQLVVSLKPTLEKVRICESLLNFKADPNIKTDPNHWLSIGQQVLGEGFNDVQNQGKNALHLLSIREDFIHDPDDFLCMMATVLVLKGCRADDLYLGHTPLSLATLRGNIKLVKFLLDTRQVDPHQLLGNEMGNALTVLLLNRFSSYLPEESKKLVVATLVNNGLNPLNRIGIFENAIGFMEHEHELAKLARLSSGSASKSKKHASNKSLKSSSRSLSKGSGSASSRSLKASKRSLKASSRSLKASKKSLKTSSKYLKKGSSRKLGKSSSSMTSSKNRRSHHSRTKVQSVENYVIEISKKILIRHVKAQAVKYLYTLVLESLVADPVIVILTKFFTPEEALNILPLLFQYGKLDLDEVDFAGLYNFLTFTKIQHNIDPELTNRELEKIHEIMKIRTVKPTEKLPLFDNFILPEVEEGDKYKLCYGCLLSEGKRLLKCPSCELVYFCSEKCNEFSNKFDRHHYCKVLFYDTIDEIIGPTKQPSRLGVMFDMANKMREERLSILKFVTIEERKLKRKLRTVRDSLETSKIAFELKRLATERKGLTNAGTLWDYGVVPPIGNKETSEQNLTPALLPKSVTLNEQPLKQEFAHKVPSSHAVRSSILRSLNFLPTIQASDFKPDEDRQSDTDKNVSSHGLKSGRRRRRSSLLRDYNITNKPSPIAKLFTKTFDKMTHPEFSPTLQPEIKRSMIIKKESSENVRVVNKNYYMELLSKIFADFNLPLMLLPYACYKDGQVYYRMTGNSSYFGFHKLKIPE